MKKKARPEKRVLVRWNDELDKQVLLSIQWACAHSGIKIPWEKVAKMMGDKFSEGAIIQHLAKLRLKMEELGIGVPPPLKRGGVATEASSLYANTSKKSKDFLSLNIGMNTPKNVGEAALYAPSPSTPTPRSRKRGTSNEDDDDMPDLSDDTDDGYSVRKKPRSTRKPQKSKRASQASKTTIKAESPSPAYATRGIRKNYKQYDQEFSEDDNEDVERECSDEDVERPNMEDENLPAPAKANSNSLISPGSVSPRSTTLLNQLPASQPVAKHQSRPDRSSFTLPDPVDGRMPSFWITTANPSSTQAAAPNSMDCDYSIGPTAFPYPTVSPISTHSRYLLPSPSSGHGSFNAGVPMMLTPNYLHNGTVPSNGTFTLNPANDSSLWRTKSDMLDKNSDGHFHAGIDLPFDNQDKEEGETPDNPDLGLDDSFNSFYSPCQ